MRSSLTATKSDLGYSTPSAMSSGAIDMTTSPTARVMLLLMVKNEAAILLRCLNAASPLCDAILVADTGSTDATCALASEFAAAQPTIPLRVVHHVWKDFGHNRTLSYEAAAQYASDLGWTPTSAAEEGGACCTASFLLAVDADMRVKLGDGITPVTVKRLLHMVAVEKGASGVLLSQGTEGFQYANLRFLRLPDAKLRGTWKCVERTHEFWTFVQDAAESAPVVTTRLPDTVMTIDDVGDGGCKSDKFERDLALLTLTLEEEPDNARAVFYLAQTYECLGRREDAIKAYKKRTTMGGFAEEVWYAHYKLAKQYLLIGTPDAVAKAELWVQRGAALRAHRAEGFMALHTHFCDHGVYLKAWHYLAAMCATPTPCTDTLFVETPPYSEAFRAFRKGVTAFYVVHTLGVTTAAGVDGCLTSLASPAYAGTALENLRFYVQPAGGGTLANWRPLAIPSVSDTFVASSIAVDASTGTMCIRTVNYHVTPLGQYVLPGPGCRVTTENLVAHWDWAAGAIVPGSVRPLDERRQLQSVVGLPCCPDAAIVGIEDLRLQGSVWTATSQQYSCEPGGVNRILYGRHFPSLHDACVVRTPMAASVYEKNWLPMPDGVHLIYGWSPFRVGVVKHADTPAAVAAFEVTHTVTDVPSWFAHVRGSVPPLLYKDRLWTLTHIVNYSTPRTYMHLWVLLDKDTFHPVGHTRPFYFRALGIEYCIGASVHDGHTLTLFASSWDREPAVLTMPMAWFESTDMLVLHAAHNH